jgi:hypothetical protein
MLGTVSQETNAMMKGPGQRRLRQTVSIVAIAALSISCVGQTQSPAPNQIPRSTPAAPESNPTVEAQNPPATPVAATTPVLVSRPTSAAEAAVASEHAAESANTAEPAAAPKIYTVPAGTRVLLQLRSAVNTKSARAGDGVYLASTFPVVVGTRVMIPAGVYVQGVVDNVVHPGRLKGSAQLNMHFTSIIFPNGTVVEIPGMVNSLPGSRTTTMKDGEGTIEGEKNKGRNAGKVAEIGIPTGGTIGTIGGAISGHPITGGLVGLAAGAAAAGLVALFTKGAEINIESGTPVEMVLQRPLALQEENFSAATPQGTSAPGLVPAANQPRPLEKPTAASKPQLLCPIGSLGCL